MCRRVLSLKSALTRSCFSDKNIRTAAVIDDSVGFKTSWKLCVVDGGKLLVKTFNKLYFERFLEAIPTVRKEMPF